MELYRKMFQGFGNIAVVQNKEALMSSLTLIKFSITQHQCSKLSEIMQNYAK